MKYLEWLQHAGFDVGGLKITEKEAAEAALPLKDPGTEEMKSINTIVLHHSATEKGNAACFRVLHRIVNRWNDVGYHYVIGNGSLSGDGEIEEGRKLPFRGAHARGGNDNSIGICLVGNFNLTTPTHLQMKSLGILFKGLREAYPLNRESLTLHRLVKGSRTECPGRNLSMKDVLYLYDNT